MDLKIVKPDFQFGPNAYTQGHWELPVSSWVLSFYYPFIWMDGCTGLYTRECHYLKEIFSRYLREQKNLWYFLIGHTHLPSHFRGQRQEVGRRTKANKYNLFLLFLSSFFPSSARNTWKSMCFPSITLPIRDGDSKEFLENYTEKVTWMERLTKTSTI